MLRQSSRLIRKLNHTSSSSSSCAAHIINFLSLSLSLIHCVQVFQTTFCTRTERLKVRSYKSANTSVTMWEGPQQKVTYKFVLASPAVPVAARAVSVITLRHSRFWVALRPAVPAAARIWPSVSWQLEISYGFRGHPPRLLPLSRGLGLFPCAWGTPNKRNAEGVVGIFGKCRARVGSGPALGPTKKRPCSTLSR